MKQLVLSWQTAQSVADLAAAGVGGRGEPFGGRGGAGESLDPFADLRRELAYRWSGRGFKVVADEPIEQQPESYESESPSPDWTTASITVLVEE